MQFKALLLTVFCLLLTGCDLGSPEQVSSAFQQKLEGFFPRAKVEYYEQHQAFIGFSCTTGTSSAFAQQIAQMVARDRQLNEMLNELRMARSLSGKPQYTFLAIGFEHDLVVYDLAARTIGIRSDLPGYDDAYRRVCSL